MKVRGGALVAKTLKKYGVQDDLDADGGAFRKKDLSG